MHGFGDIGLFAEAGAFQNLLLELEGGIVEVAGEGGVFHELVEFDAEVGRGTVAGEVDEVNGSGSGHDVYGGSEYEEGAADDDADEVVLEVEPEMVEILRVHLCCLNNDYGHQRDETECPKVSDEIMVTQFHVLQIHTLKKIW